MSHALPARDGFPNVSSGLIRQDIAIVSQRVKVTSEDAANWAHENGLKLKRGESPIAKINSKRRALSLPAFEIVANTSAAKERRYSSRPTPPQELGLLVKSEDDLWEKINSFSGTITGIVTPEIAGWILPLNTANRPIQKSMIERFRRILQGGNWSNTGEPAIIAREAVLNDGQHRLIAIQETGISAEMDIRFGVPRDVFDQTGTGKRRSAGDVLNINGHSNVTAQAAIARMLHQYDAGQMGESYRATLEISEILQIVEADERIAQFAAHTARYRFKPARAAPLGFVMVLAARSSPIDKVFEFADAVASGSFQQESEPARQLHVRLRDMALNRQRMRPIDQVALTVKAWNAWVEGPPWSVLKLKASERSGAGFPVLRPWKVH